MYTVPPANTDPGFSQTHRIECTPTTWIPRAKLVATISKSIFAISSYTTLYASFNAATKGTVEFRAIIRASSDRGRAETAPARREHR